MSAGNQPDILRTWGFWAVLASALALALVFVQIVGPTIDPEPAAAGLGEIAGEIKRSAWRSFLGLPRPEPTVETLALWDYAALAAPLLGIVGVVLSLVSGVMRENWRFPVYGTVLGGTAIVFFYVWWLALLVAAVLLLIAIIVSIGGIFSL